MALTAREARLRYYFNKGQDYWFNYHLWPIWAQQLILLEHKSDSQMFNLMFFFLGNGLAPGTSKNWVMASDYVKDDFLYGPYTKKEIQDIDRIIIKAANNQLFKGLKKVYDMIQQRPIYM